MSGFFAEAGGLHCANLDVVFDAERQTPDLIDELADAVPHIRDVIGSLRESLPLVAHSGIGPAGSFYRLPNHYRSVSFLLPPAGVDPEAAPGVIVFKGTEPLLPDFPLYFDWMLNAPFRSSPLPIGLHFPLDMRLPPAAMWMEECMAEQKVSSRIQQLYLRRHGRLARLPLPLCVLRMTPGQVKAYEECVCSRISAEAFGRFRNKLNDGLGVEVYYYPELPVRVADLFFGDVRNAFKEFLVPGRVEATFSRWARLLAEILCLGYMPFVPWHHGVGACIDAGNACIDGGFNDLLTLVPFETIPGDVLFHRSLHLSVQILSESMTRLSAGCIGLSAVVETDAAVMAVNYLRDNLGSLIRASEHEGHAVDARLKAFFAPPSAADILQLLSATHPGKGRRAQFVHMEVADLSMQRTQPKAASGV
jgi:hypothetical protein